MFGVVTDGLRLYVGAEPPVTLPVDIRDVDGEGAGTDVGPPLRLAVSPDGSQVAWATGPCVRIANQGYAAVPSQVSADSVADPASPTTLTMPAGYSHAQVAGLSISGNGDLLVLVDNEWSSLGCEELLGRLNGGFNFPNPIGPSGWAVLTVSPGSDSLKVLRRFGTSGDVAAPADANWWVLCTNRAVVRADSNGTLSVVRYPARLGAFGCYARDAGLVFATGQQIVANLDGGGRMLPPGACQVV
jgi:hypothetical protein